MRPSLNVDVFRPGNGHQGDPWSRPWTAARSSPQPRRGPAACCCPPRSPTPAAAARRRSRLPLAREVAFPQGVASGQPGTDGITLWMQGRTASRATRACRSRGADADFRRVIYRKGPPTRAPRRRSRSTTAPSTRVLKPGERYLYRFFSCTDRGPRRPLPDRAPADSTTRHAVGYFSCQDYESGYSPPSRARARGRPGPRGLPRRLHLRPRLRRRPVRPDTAGDNRDDEVQTLPEYREKYAALPHRREHQAMRTAPRWSRCGTTTRSRTTRRATSPTRPRWTRADVPHPPATGFKALFETCPPARGRPPRPYLRLACGSAPTSSCSCSTRAPTATTSPAASGSSPPAPTTRPRADLLGATQQGWLKGGLASRPRVGRCRQPGDGALARCPSARPRRQGRGRLPGRATPPSAPSCCATSSPSAGRQGRRLPHRGHPHVLRRAT